MQRKLNELSQQVIAQQLKSTGVPIKIGPFNISLTSDYPALVKPISALYANYPVLDDHDFVDFNIRLLKSKGVRRFIKPQINFFLDDYCPFKPLPLDEAFALLEWGMNWCIGAHAHQYLIVHSAVLAKNGKVLILPGEPGSGKSTLCAALCGEGWHLLSDELALVDKKTGLVHPVARPISLKNKSIDVITKAYQHLQPASKVYTRTKGDVAHIPLPINSIDNMYQPLPPKLIVFPKYKPEIDFQAESLSQPESFLKTIDNCFNYSQLGLEGFNVMGDLIATTESYTIKYNNLPAAIAFISEKMDN